MLATAVFLRSSREQPRLAQIFSRAPATGWPAAAQCRGEYLAPDGRNGWSTTSARCAPSRTSRRLSRIRSRAIQLFGQHPIAARPATSASSRFRFRAPPMISVHALSGRARAKCWRTLSPRRYFCTACHVPQANIRPLGRRTHFVDMERTRSLRSRRVIQINAVNPECRGAGGLGVSRSGPGAY